mmetsp:Transcript_22252/g.33639  ORF Transcript_22252/g.33639 Transcript_22252/m.33639 type:complete len:444 (-) Transcript_22252:450-1781(-)
MSNIYQAMQAKGGTSDESHPKKGILNRSSSSFGACGNNLCDTSSTSTINGEYSNFFSCQDRKVSQGRSSSNENNLQTSPKSKDRLKERELVFELSKKETIMISLTAKTKNIIKFRESSDRKSHLCTRKKNEIDEDSDARPKMPSRRADIVYSRSHNRNEFSIDKVQGELEKVKFSTKEKVLKFDKGESELHIPEQSHIGTDKSESPSIETPYIIHRSPFSACHSGKIEKLCDKTVEKIVAKNYERGPVDLDEEYDKLFGLDHHAKMNTNDLSLTGSAFSSSCSEKEEQSLPHPWYPRDDNTLPLDQDLKTETSPKMNEDNNFKDNDSGDGLCEDISQYLFVPEALDLMDPLTFDVMTCASGESGISGIFTVHTYVDDKAFEGELWNRLHQMETSVSTTKRMRNAEQRLRTKYDKYRNLQTPIDKNKPARLAEHFFPWSRNKCN